jgi:hypothetical protein
MRGPPAVRVVEPDDTEAAVRQGSAEAVGPRDQLRAGAHDEQHGRCLRVADALVCHLDAGRADIGGLLFAHRSLLRLGAKSKLARSGRYLTHGNCDFYQAAERLFSLVERAARAYIKSGGQARAS